LPEQILVNKKELAYFGRVHVLALVCTGSDLRKRSLGRASNQMVETELEVRLNVNRRPAPAASATPPLRVFHASLPRSHVEIDARGWMEEIMRSSAEQSSTEPGPQSW
jgi:hypothetical protein